MNLTPSLTLSSRTVLPSTCQINILSKLTMTLPNGARLNLHHWEYKKTGGNESQSPTKSGK